MRFLPRALVNNADVVPVAALTAPAHTVALYERDSDLTNMAGTFLSEALAAGDSAVAIASEAHLNGIDRCFGAAGIDRDEVQAEGRLVRLEAQAILSEVLRDGEPDADRFRATIAPVMERARAAGRGDVRSFGEMVALLWAGGRETSALCLEGLWNDLASEVGVELLCAYPVPTLVDGNEPHMVAEVCHAHSRVLPAAEEQEVPAAAAYPVMAFRPGLDAPGEARRFVVDAVQDIGRPEVADDAALVTSELATNAVRHAGSDFVVVVAPAEDGVRISVRDDAPVRPVPREPGPFDTSGRGLHLVSSVAQRWGSESLTNGKLVWAHL